MGFSLGDLQTHAQECGRPIPPQTDMRGYLIGEEMGANTRNDKGAGQGRRLCLSLSN
jgi:hypothetical protein